MIKFHSFLTKYLLLTVILTVYIFGKDDFVDVPAATSQLIVVESKKDGTVELSCYERNRKSIWSKVIEGISVNIGKNGFNKKKEGDAKTPVGIFSLDKIYVYSLIDTKMPQFLVDEDLICVDDPNSRYYNLIIDSKRVLKDFKSYEHMKREDNLYEIVITVGYNRSNTPFKGSCIFLHIARQNSATAGCIAMQRNEILDIAKWLDPIKKPMILIND